MKNVFRRKAYTAYFDLGESPAAPPTVTLYHEWGDQIGGTLTSTLDSGTIYKVNLTSSHTESSGVLKLKWSYSVGATAKSQNSFLNIYSQYIDSLTFFDRHPETEDAWGDRFDELELKTRNIINTYCGQEFDIKISKTITLDGSDSKTLFLPLRIDSVAAVDAVVPTVSGTSTDDITSLIEIHPESRFFLRAIDSQKFSKNAQFKIRGDWGWPYVPQNVTEAADYIILDLMNDDAAYRQHGVTNVRIDTHEMSFTDSIFGSTGNIDADVLLMDYTLYFLTMI